MDASRFGFNRILVALRGRSSERSLLEYARALATDTAEVRAVHAIDIPRYGIYGDELVHWHDRMIDRLSMKVQGETTALMRVVNLPVKMSGVVREGRPGPVIVRAAEEFDADLVLAGGGEHTGVDASSLATEVAGLIEQCPRPLLVAASTRPPDAILAPINFSSLSRRGLRLGVGLAKCFDVPLHVVHVLPTYVALYPDIPAEDWWDTPYASTGPMSSASPDADVRLRDEIEKAGGKEISARAVILEGAEAGGRIAEYAATFDNPLVIMGSLGRAALEGLFVGRTARRVFKKVRGSLLTFKTADFRSPLLDAEPATTDREPFEVTAG